MRSKGIQRHARNSPPRVTSMRASVPKNLKKKLGRERDLRRIRGVVERCPPQP
jgi:hypothetical protein